MNAKESTETGEHLQFVEVVEVFEREDGVYVFAELEAAERFEQAVAAGRDLPGDESATYRRETPINVGEAAERLIAAERGDALESIGWPALGEDVREGLAPEAAIARLRSVASAEDRAKAEGMIAGWCE